MTKANISEYEELEQRLIEKDAQFREYFTTTGVIGDRKIKDPKPIDRGTDIVALQWNGGYAFLVNNPKCTTIRTIDIMGTHDISIKEGTYPFVYYNELLPSEYYFLDAEGKEVP